MTAQSLVETAKLLVAPGKGILAADESTGTIGKRFAALGIENTEENRRDYREMLFTAPGSSDHISGAILYDETLRQKASGGGTIVDLLASRSIIPGIKVDTGVHPLAGAPGEVVTEGLDGLRDRLAEYREIGARFAKWRAVLTIGPDIPSRYCIEVNAHALARYAALCQEAGIVPIVEPEVMMDGTHTIHRCREATEATLGEVYDQLDRQRVMLEGTLLKPNMVISGKDAADRAESDEVAEKTLDCLMRTVPESVPGIVFLSGGQGDEEATANLNALSVLGRKSGAPWEISFSYGRALQSAPLGVWAECRDRESSQKAFMRRTVLTATARRGEYTPAMA
jgi:fructose-bisphosphate aldolase class I